MRFLLLIMLFLVCSFSYAQNHTNFSQVDVELDVGQSLPLSNNVSFDVEVSDPESLTKALRNWGNVRVNHVGDDSLTVSLTGQPLFLGKFREQYLANTFVIDIEENSVKDFVSTFKKGVNESVTVSGLTKFVNDYISEPTYVNGFNIASVVADQRSGDCTEYAVLSTALARSLGIPSRIVFGSVILEKKADVVVYGHAWSEVFIDGQWQILDAALYESEAIQHFYLPVGELDNEGPGFSLSMFSLVGRMPIKISELKSL